MIHVVTFNSANSMILFYDSVWVFFPLIISVLMSVGKEISDFLFSPS